MADGFSRCSPIFLLRKIKGKSKRRITHIKLCNKSALTLSSMLAPMSDHARLKHDKRSTCFQIIFFAFLNLKNATIACPILANLSVAMAICGGNHTKIKKGMESKLPQPTIDQSVPAMMPIKNTHIDGKYSNILVVVRC